MLQPIKRIMPATTLKQVKCRIMIFSLKIVMICIIRTEIMEIAIVTIVHQKIKAKEKKCMKNRKNFSPFKKRFVIAIVSMFMLVLLFSLAGCNKNADVKIFLVDKNNIAIADTELIVQGISDKDVAATYTTDSNGQFMIKNLGERTITIIIHVEGNPFRTDYTVTKDDLKQEKITIKLNNYEK